MTDHETFLSTELARLLRPGERMLLAGIAQSSLGFIASFLLKRAGKHWYVILTDQRVLWITLKKKLLFRWWPIPGFAPTPIPSNEGVDFLELGDIARVTQNAESVATMLWGRRGCGIVGRDGKSLSFVTRRREPAFSERQREFYESFVGKLAEIRQLPAAA